MVKISQIIVGILYAGALGIWSYIRLGPLKDTNDLEPYLFELLVISFIFAVAICISYLAADWTDRGELNLKENLRRAWIWLITPFMFLASAGFVWASWSKASETYTLREFILGIFTGHLVGVWMLFASFFPLFAGKTPKRTGILTGPVPLVPILAIPVFHFVRYYYLLALDASPAFFTFTLSFISVSVFYTFVRLFIVSGIRRQ